MSGWEQDGWTMNSITGLWSPPSRWWCSSRKGYFVPNGGHIAPGWTMSMTGRLQRVTT
jgi:hypothetical protein